MNDKVTAIIAMIGFCAIGAIYEAAVLSGFVWHYSPGGHLALVALIALWPLCFVVNVIAVLKIADVAMDAFSERETVVREVQVRTESPKWRVFGKKWERLPEVEAEVNGRER